MKKWFVLVLCLGIATAAMAEEPETKKKPSIEQILSEGRTALEAAQPAEALMILRKGIRSRSPEAYELYSRALMNAGKPDKAVSMLKRLVGVRGTQSDYLLLALAHSMAGQRAGAAEALESARTAKEPTLEGTCSLAWQTDDTTRRAEILREAAKAFPANAAALNAEAAFWKARKGLRLREPAAAVPPEGVVLKLKTLYNLEWAVAKTDEGKEIWLLVDTACRRTVLSRYAAEKLDLEVVRSAAPLPGAYADEPAPEYAFVQSLDFKTHKVRNVPVLVVEDESGTLKYREGYAVLKGILGMDLLRGMKFAFDRKENELRLYPWGTPPEKMISGKISEWATIDAYPVHDQWFIESSVGNKDDVLGLLTTGCTLVMATEPFLEGADLKPQSKNLLDLTPGGRFTMEKTVNTRGGRSSGASGTSFTAGSVTGNMGEMDRTRTVVLGWMDECLPLAGKIKTIPTTSSVGLGVNKFQIPTLPCYPRPIGGDVKGCTVIGRQITDFFSMVFDPAANKIYLKQVLFN